MPCGELIEDGDEDNPPSEQQPRLTRAKHLFHTAAIFFPTLQSWSWKALVHPFHLKHESPFKIFKFTICNGKWSHSDLYAMRKLALQHTNTDVHLSAWHLAHTQGGTPVSIGRRCQLNTNLE